MLPSTWLAVLLFLFLILPGLVFVMLAERRRVLPPQSTFREISGVTVWSLLFTVASLLVAVIVYVSFRPAVWLPDPDAFANDPGKYGTEHYVITTASLLSIVALSTALSTVPHLVYLFRSRKRLGHLIGSESAWQRSFVTDRGEASRLYLRVKIDDGTVYAGSLVAHSPDFNNDDRELILGHPGLAVKQPGDSTRLQELPSHWKRVVLHGSKIRAITVGYLIDPSPADPPENPPPAP